MENNLSIESKWEEKNQIEQKQKLENNLISDLKITIHETEKQLNESEWKGIGKARTKIIKNKDLNRTCPKCNTIKYYSSKMNLARAIKYNKMCNSCAHKGQISQNKGKKHTEEAKEKIRIARSKQVFSEETKIKMRERMLRNNPFKGKTHTEKTKIFLKKWQKENSPKGENHPLYGKSPSPETIEKIKKNMTVYRREQNLQWNPNKTDEERECERAIPRYKRFIRKCLESVDYKCQLTGKRSKTLQCHHLYSYSRYRELREDPSNIIVILKEIHDKFHRIYGRTKFTPEDFIQFLKDEKYDNIKINIPNLPK